MTNLICIIIGLYLVLDAIYLASVADKEYRNCMIAKHVCAAMSGAYLIFLGTRDLLVDLEILDRLQYALVSDDAMQVLLLFGVTISFFMWPDTFWRGLGHMQIYRPKLHQWLISHFKINARRVTDRNQ